jgi:hypothetical protein
MNALAGRSCRATIVDERSGNDKSYPQYKRSPFSVRRWPFTVHRSPFTVHRSPFAVRRSPFAVHRLAFAVQRSPGGVWRSEGGGSSSFPVYSWFMVLGLAQIRN